MTQQTETFDAIVVGSGISGGWAAKELTERGLRVLMLERGKNVEHRKDYPNARKSPWEYPHRGGRTRPATKSGPRTRSRQLEEMAMRSHSTDRRDFLKHVTALGIRLPIVSLFNAEEPALDLRVTDLVDDRKRPPNRVSA